MIKGGISIECLYKENMYQTAENTSKMPKYGKDNMFLVVALLLKSSAFDKICHWLCRHKNSVLQNS